MLYGSIGRCGPLVKVMPLVESVTLCGVLPAVFRGDVPAESEIWLAGRVELRRACPVFNTAESRRGKKSQNSDLY